MIERRGRRRIVPNFQRQLARVRFTVNFPEQHFDRARRAAATRFFQCAECRGQCNLPCAAEPISLPRARRIARSAKRRHGFAHARSGFSRRQAINPRIGELPISVHAGIFDVHRGHARYRQFVGNCIARLDAHHTVASGIESGPGNNNLRLSGPHGIQDARDRFILVLVKVIVADIDRAHDHRLSTRFRLQSPRRPGAALDDADRHTGFFLAAETGKKLIDDVNDVDHESNSLRVQNVQAVQSLRSVQPVGGSNG